MHKHISDFGGAIGGFKSWIGTIA